MSDLYTPALGRFLEISVHAPQIQESLAFYESLGFVQAPVGEIWPYPYAVVTDGRLFLGLHGEPIASPSLTFVLPQLEHRIAQLKRSGLSFDEERFGADAFHQALLRDRTGQSIILLEARTFSPPPLDAPLTSSCGYFSEFGIPVREPHAARAFWEAVGFVALDEQIRPFARIPLTGDLLNLALYRTRACRAPLLTFEDPYMPERLARLRERGLELSDEMPDGLDDAANAVLISPEGTRLLLLQSED